MKKHHFVLIVVLAGIAAYFLIQNRKLGDKEANTRAELAMLRDAARKMPAVANASTSMATRSRPPAINPAKFVTELGDVLKGTSGEDTRKGMTELVTSYQAQLASAPLSKLKEICALLEKDFALDHKDSEMARNMWFTIMGLAAKSDPAWGFAKFEEATSSVHVPIDVALGTFRRWATMNGETMNPSYAAALRKWLDEAQAAGRIEEGNPLVAELRAEIAAAQRDPSAAVRQISQLPYLSQREAAINHAAGLQTPEAQRRAMEELSSALHVDNFPHFVRKLADQQGFDAARQILGSASLTPEKHDLAAASIASANIGPETPAKAKWLLESLRSEDRRAVAEFANYWTLADHQGAAQWVNSLPAGKQRDIAVAGFAPVAARIDGATAVDWALTLTDSSQRAVCLAEVHRVWKALDPEAANSYLKQKGIAVK